MLELPSKDFSSAIYCWWYSELHWLRHNSKWLSRTEGILGGKERELLSRMEPPFQTSIYFPPVESIWVRKVKRDTEEREQESRKTTEIKVWILSYLQHFHKDSGVSTRKKTHQSFPADSSLLCSPHEAWDFCLRLPVSQQSQLSTNHSQTPSRPEGKYKNGFNKTISNTAHELSWASVFFFKIMNVSRGNWPSQIKREGNAKQ